MSKEVKVVYENFKSKYKVVPAELIVEGDKLKYNRAKKRAKDIELTRDYIGKRDKEHEL